MNLTTKIFIDSGDPAETRHALDRLGFLDGQTTNPSLVAKNPVIQELKKAGTLNEQTIWNEYRIIADRVHELLPNGAISVEVYADHETAEEDMLQKAHELASWFPGIYVKLPTTAAGLSVAGKLVAEGINVNMTLCFSQEQAAAVHSATRGAAKGQVFVSPFIGRLDDIGQHGVQLIQNILMMYRQWNSHVMVLAASIRGMEHFLECLKLGTDCITAPGAVLDTWAEYGIDKDLNHYPIEISTLEPIPYRDLPDQDWILYNIRHELTDKGIEKFAADWKNLFT